MGIKVGNHWKALRRAPKRMVDGFFYTIKRGRCQYPRPRFCGRADFSASHHLPCRDCMVGGFFLLVEGRGERIDGRKFLQRVAPR